MGTRDGNFQGGIPFHTFSRNISPAIDEVAILYLDYCAYNEQTDLAVGIEEGLDCIRI